MSAPAIPAARRSTCSTSVSPDLDFVSLAKAMGVPGGRAADMEEFNRRLAEGIATPGPYLVEVVF